MNNMKKFYTVIFIALTFHNYFAQEIYDLEKSISVALQKSFGIQNANYSLISSQKNLEAFKAGLFSQLDLEFDIPTYSESLSSQFNPLLSREDFFELGSTRVEGRLSLSQPIIFTNGNINLTGRLFGREQFGTNIITTKDYFTNVSISLQQPLFTFNAQSANLERAEINLENAKRHFNESEQNLIFNVKSAFYNLYKIKENVKILEEKVKQNEESYLTAKNKLIAGLIAEVEALQLEVDLASSKNELLNSQRSYEEDLANFKLLIGLELDDKIEIISNLQYLPILVDEEKAIESAINNRPDLLNQQSEIYLSQLNVEEIDSRRQIKADLVARYGLSKNDEKFSSLYADLLDDINIGLNLSIPIWDWGQNNKQVEAAEANYKISQLVYENLKKNIRNEVISAINSLNSAKARVEVLSKTVEIAEKSYDISLERFKSGTISSFDLAQMQIRLTEAKNNSLNALIDYNLSLADLERKTYLNLQ